MAANAVRGQKPCPVDGTDERPGLRIMHGMAIGAGPCHIGRGLGLQTQKTTGGKEEGASSSTDKPHNNFPPEKLILLANAAEVFNP